MPFNWLPPVGPPEVGLAPQPAIIRETAATGRQTHVRKVMGAPLRKDRQIYLDQTQPKSKRTLRHPRHSKTAPVSPSVSGTPKHPQTSRPESPAPPFPAHTSESSDPVHHDPASLVRHMSASTAVQEAVAQLPHHSHRSLQQWQSLPVRIGCRRGRSHRHLVLRRPTIV